MSHTPGPLHASEPTPMGNKTGTVRVLTADGLHTANCIWSSNPRMTQKNAIANATLYAAAPELLAALDRIVAQGCPKDTNNDGDCGRKYCPYCGKQTIEAIAKAKGETP